MHDLVLGAALMLGAPAPAADAPLSSKDINTALPATDISIPAEPEEILVTAPAGAQSPEQLTPDELAGQRGGASYVVNNQTLLGVVEGNVIGGDYAAGPVSLSDNALSNFNGLLAISINTGLQSNIISGMAITINLSE